VGAVQSTTITDLKDNQKYLAEVRVLPAVPITEFADVLSPRLVVTAGFSTGPTPPAPPAPKLVWDAICEPSTPGLGTILNTGNATQFVIGDAPKGVAVEIEFRDATDPANLLNGPVTATADMACATSAGVNADVGACGPAVAIRECLVTDDPNHFRPVWSAEQEAAAIQRARTLWSGFSYQTFRIRYVNDSVNPPVNGAWSRTGLMVSCVDKSLCTFEQNTDRITPTNAPDWSTILGADTLCDDTKRAQQVTGVISEADCIPWH
jgi:hypothetical protein